MAAVKKNSKSNKSTSSPEPEKRLPKTRKNLRHISAVYLAEIWHGTSVEYRYMYLKP